MFAFADDSSEMSSENLECCLQQVCLPDLGLILQ